MKKIITLLAILIFGWLSTAHAQDLLKGRDLSQVKVDQLTDADIAKLKNQMSTAGVTIEQAEQVAIAKGMSVEEFAKLKRRLSGNLSNNNSTVGKLRSVDKLQNNNANERRINSPDSVDRPKYQTENRKKPLIDSLIFGSELYTAAGPNFEPNMNLATPVNYVIGPTDELSVNVYGVQQYEDNIKVTPEGSIFIPNVGQIKVSGLTIEAATEKIQSALANSAYPYLKTGGAKLSVTLASIRTIRVTVIGSVFPGSINISSLATVYHALYIAGGPSQFGSFREIELIRGGKVINKIDLYKFLVNGDQSDNIGLKDNDVIRIPAYKKRIELQGQVKRPGIFEALPGEKLSDILTFASGFTDTAFKASVKIFQRTDQERALLDLDRSQYETYVPQSGDVIMVSKTIDRFANRVKLTGAVFRPDVYALTPGLTAAALIKKGNGLREDAYVGRGLIMRLRDDLTRSVVAFDVAKALGNEADPNSNPVLQREDEVLITSLQDLRDTLQVLVQGEVRMPGKYDFVYGLTVKDLILQAGGFTDAAYKNIEISRLIRRDSVLYNDYRSAQMINIEISDDLRSATSNIPLQPYDVVTIRRKAGFLLPQSITVTGQVQYPGPYTLNTLNERVSDIFARAGGALPDANLAGAFIKRKRSDVEKEVSVNAAENIQHSVKDTSSILTKEITKDFDQIPLDLPYVLQHRGSTEDIMLRENDELVIPKSDAQVKVRGGVLLSTQIPYQASFTVSDYVAAAGGYGSRAWKNKLYVIYPNGKAAITKHFLFFKFSPKILPGSEIVVPLRPERKSLSTGEVIGISSALASLAGVVIAVLRL